MAGAVPEALSAESHRVVLPSCYVRILRSENTRDTESLERIDLIYAGRLYDFASMHSSGTNDLYVVSSGQGRMYIFRAPVPAPSAVSSVWEASRESLSLRLSEIVEEYDAMYGGPAGVSRQKTGGQPSGRTVARFVNLRRRRVFWSREPGPHRRYR